MRGLMEKDLRLTLARKQTLLIFCVMGLVMGISMDGPFVIGYLTMLAAIVAVGTISYDEYDNGFAFLMTLPFDRKTYVREKYLFSLILAVGAWCAGVMLHCAGSVVRRNAITMTSELPMLLALIPAFYLSASIMIPLRLKYGSEKSRTVLVVIFGIIAVLLFGSNKLLRGGNNLAGLAAYLDGKSPVAVLAAITAVCLLAAYVLYLWSIRIMEKKEF